MGFQAESGSVGAPAVRQTGSPEQRQCIYIYTYFLFCITLYIYIYIHICIYMYVLFVYIGGGGGAGVCVEDGVASREAAAQADNKKKT